MKPACRIAATGVAVIFLASFFAATTWGQSIGTQSPFRAYHKTVWQDQDGLPQNTVLHITQSAEGYLWLGTMGGVARFDGVHFTVFDGSNTPELKSDLINSIIPEPDSSVWVGTEAGLARRDADGRFIRFTSPEGLARPLSTRLEK
ncbi:MAG TPA: two-component regulator propeller domain-containing protein, partial [Chthoniobacterales bacterium]